MTRFAYEVPLAHLVDFDVHQDFHFALSFLCDDPYYKEYLKEYRQDKLVIVDNSFNELGIPDTPSRMALLFASLNADFVVSPDCDSWSLEELRNSYREMVKLVPAEKILVVVKSEAERSMFTDEGAFKYCTTYEQRMYLPMNLLTLSYHFLGMINIWEVRRYTPTSCDTGMPIKLALEGKSMDQWIREGCPHIKTKPEYFDITLTERELALAKENCEWINAKLVR